ncbi:MAG: hypothetical protein AB7N76_10695 [Planctomycetota bacterium]
MSGKKQQRREEQLAQDVHVRAVLLRRRLALALYVVCLILTVVGAEVGPWWDTWVGDKQLGETMVGREFMRYRYERPAGAEDELADPMAKYQRIKVETPAPLIPAHLVTLLCIVAFLISSYCLVADEDIQRPTFALTVLIVALAGWVAYTFWSDNAVLDDVLRSTLATEIQAKGAKHARQLPRIQVRWGLALFLAAAPALFLTSTYLTFVADRGRKETPTQ